jgi:gamma-glutamylcyclotransferase (GGCT)/AIG2-like uncharacterized protein YtfP
VRDPAQSEKGFLETPKLPVRLFSYGTLQDRCVQLQTFGRELAGKPDVMPGFVQTLVEITDPQVLATSGKTHHPIVQPSARPTDEVPGTLFGITEQELLRADSYEVADYKRVSVTLKSGQIAWIYVRA